MLLDAISPYELDNYGAYFQFTFNFGMISFACIAEYINTCFNFQSMILCTMKSFKKRCKRSQISVNGQIYVQ